MFPDTTTNNASEQNELYKVDNLSAQLNQTQQEIVLLNNRVRGRDSKPPPNDLT